MRWPTWRAARPTRTRHIVSVRQRRDYRVPSVAALIKAATTARRDAMDGEEGADDPVESVGEAVLELLQSGDGSLAALDVPELEPLDGLVAVVEVDDALDLGRVRRDRRCRAVHARRRGIAWSAGSTSTPYADLDDDDEDEQTSLPAVVRRRRPSGRRRCLSRGSRR